MFNLTCEICNIQYQAITIVSKVCSGKCRQKRYRLTDKGKSSVTKYNLQHYKRRELRYKCISCGNYYMSARSNRTICNKPECIKKAKYLAQIKCRNKDKRKYKARDIVNKRIKRGVSLTRQLCSICNKPNAEAHHKDYNKPLDITWLCKQHHIELHKNIAKL